MASTPSSAKQSGQNDLVKVQESLSVRSAKSLRSIKSTGRSTGRFSAAHLSDSADSSDEPKLPNLVPTTRGVRLLKQDAWDRYRQAQAAEFWHAASFKQQASALPLRKRVPVKSSLADELDQAISSMRQMSLKMTVAQQRQMAEYEQRNKALWNEIEGVIAQHESEMLRVSKIKQKEAEEQAKIMKAEEEKKAEERRKKQELERRLQERIQSEKEEAERKMEAAKAEKASDEGQFNYWVEQMLEIKQTLATVQNDDVLRKQCSVLKRQINPKIGQMTMDGEHLMRLIGELDQILKQASGPAYVWLLNHLAKRMIKQAEEEVTARTAVAFPLGQACVTLICMGHTDFARVLKARLIKKCPFVLPFVPRRPESLSEADHRKMLGHRDGETGVQYVERMSGILALYLAVLGSNAGLGPRFRHEQQLEKNLPEDLHMSASWTWLVRAMNLSSHLSIPHHIAVFVDVLGADFLRAFGRQAQKLLRCLHNEGLVANKGAWSSESKPSVARLTILIEQWLQSGKLDSLDKSWT